MKFNNWFATGYGDDSRWDETISCELADEIERIDNANRRKRKALKQMIKAVERRTKIIEGLEEYTEYLENKNNKLKEYTVCLENEIDELNDWIDELL